MKIPHADIKFYLGFCSLHLVKGTITSLNLTCVRSTHNFHVDSLKATYEPLSESLTPLKPVSHRTMNLVRRPRHSYSMQANIKEHKSFVLHGPTYTILSVYYNVLITA